MSYNIKHGNSGPPNTWSARRGAVADVIREAGADVVGTQEALYDQVRDLDADLPGYSWIGLGREGGSRGEMMAVFYRRERLEPIAFDHFWLSSTPDEMGSTSWGNVNRRMVTWVRFRDQQNGNEFYFFNTHFDHRIDQARVNSAYLVTERMAKLDEPLPTILVGDFNAVAETSKPYDIFVDGGDVSWGSFRDTWLVAGERTGEGLDTTNDWVPPAPRNGQRIDWVLVDGPIDVHRAAIIDTQHDGRFPSDHFPVTAYLTIGEVPNEEDASTP